MNIKEILSESFRYPLSNPKRLIFLGVLLVFSILIIPAILAYGYMLRIIEYSLNGSNELPPFNEWLNMFVGGLKFIIVNIVYLFIPGIIVAFASIFILLILRAYSFVSPATDFNAFLTMFFAIILVVGLIIMTIPYLLSLIALPHIVKNDKLDVLLEIKNLLNIIREIGWVKYLSAVVLLTVFSVILSGLNISLQYLHVGLLLVYAISALVGLFISSYLLAFRGRLLALLYQEGVEEA